MSAATVDRWNSIPLVREKRSRSRSSKEDDSDDDVSLVSRSPSPPLNADPKNISEYDSMVRGVAREIITLETKLPPTNIGHKLLAKMGWKDGQGLGVSGEGRPDPIPFELKRDSMGLGKAAQDSRVIAMTAAQRRNLDSERQVKETEEQRRMREEAVAKQVAIKNEIGSTLKPFYCQLCDKQYNNVTQYDEHVRSYAHTHKQRFKAMEASQRPKDTSKAREKERKREEKELKRLAAASGVKLAAAATVTPTATAPVAATTAEAGTTAGWGGFKKKEGGFKSSGWATVSADSSNPGPSPMNSGGWSRLTNTSQTSGSGWNPVQSQSSEPAQPPPPPLSPKPPVPPAPSIRHLPPSFQRSGFTNLDTTAPSPMAQASFGPPVNSSAASASRSDGWALVTAPSPGVHAKLPADSPPPPPPQPPKSGWSSIPPNPQSQASSWSRVGAALPSAPPPPTPLLPPPPPPPDGGYRDLGRPLSPPRGRDYDRRGWGESSSYPRPPSPRQNEIRDPYYARDPRETMDTDRYSSSKRYEDRGRGMERNRGRRWG